MLRWISILFLGISVAHAEYRVFRLHIETAPGAVQTVESTLDPDQYRAYNIVPLNANITYSDTWRCWGRTDDKPLCPSPRGPAQSPDSQPSPPANP